MTVTGITPNEGPAKKGTKVTVSGTNFATTASKMEVKVGTTVVNLTDCSATQLTFYVPSTYGAGAQTVTVTRKDTNETATIQYTYKNTTLKQDMDITFVSPNSGEVAVSKQVTITGKGFVSGGNFKVMLGTTELSVVSVTNTEIVSYIPNTLAVGKYPLKIINRDGTTKVLVDAYECTAAPIKSGPNVTSVNPTNGSADMSYKLELDGTNFKGAAKATVVTFAGQKVNFTTNTDTQLVFYAPKLPVGIYDIVITNSFGKSITISYTVN